MKFTRDEILLIIALVVALGAGALVKQYRVVHPLPTAQKTPISKKK